MFSGWSSTTSTLTSLWRSELAVVSCCLEAKPTPHRSDQPLRIDRLGDELRATRFEPLLSVVRHRLVGERKDRQFPIGINPPNLTGQLKTVHSPQTDAVEHQLHLATRHQNL